MEIAIFQKKQHLTDFVDLVYMCYLGKRTLHIDTFFNEMSFHVGCPPSGAKSDKTCRSSGYLNLLCYGNRVVI